jgi:hypothetical protein
MPVIAAKGWDFFSDWLVPKPKTSHRGSQVDQQEPGADHLVFCASHLDLGLGHFDFGVDQFDLGVD